MYRPPGWWYKPDFIINDLNVQSAIGYPAHDEVVPLAAGTYPVRGYAYCGESVGRGRGRGVERERCAARQAPDGTWRSDRACPLLLQEVGGRAGSRQAFRRKPCPPLCSHPRPHLRCHLPTDSCPPFLPPCRQRQQDHPLRGEPRRWQELAAGGCDPQHRPHALRQALGLGVVEAGRAHR